MDQAKCQEIELDPFFSAKEKAAYGKAVLRVCVKPPVCIFVLYADILFRFYQQICRDSWDGPVCPGKRQR